MEAYCVKCKSKREIQDGQKVTMKNGPPGHEGEVPALRDGALPDFCRRLDLGLVTISTENGYT